MVEVSDPLSISKGGYVGRFVAMSPSCDLPHAWRRNVLIHPLSLGCCDEVLEVWCESILLIAWSSFLYLFGKNAKVFIPPFGIKPRCRAPFVHYLFTCQVDSDIEEVYLLIDVFPWVQGWGWVDEGVQDATPIFPFWHQNVCGKALYSVFGRWHNLLGMMSAGISSRAWLEP